MPTIHLIIRGKVQGVFYRASAREVAERTGITGWVKNTEEGDVEMVVTGTTDQLSLFKDWCRKGPPEAKVTAVEEKSLPDQAFERFRIVRY
ncbi:MAG: acylphosphatase [Flavisolibacter sp.]